MGAYGSGSYGVGAYGIGSSGGGGGGTQTVATATATATAASESLTWIDVDGNQFPLDDTSTYFAEGPLPPVGQYGLPLSIVGYQVPLMPGQVEQWIQIAPNDIRFPLSIFGSNPVAMDTNIRALSEAMRPTRGVGILQHTANDGAIRQLFCRETSRFRDVALRSPTRVQVGLIFSAADPFWYDANWTVLTFVPGGVVSFFQTPFFPVHLSAGGLSSAFTIQNNGQAETWPVWMITGPGTNPQLRNTTTGETLTLNITLTSGQILTVDTRPGIINVTREDGSNQWAIVQDTSTIWPLIVGPNVISLNMTGTTNESQLQLQYKQRYEGV